MVDLVGQAISGSLAASGDTSATPFFVRVSKPINLELSGAWSGTVTLKRKLPGNSAYSALSVNGTAWAVYTTNVSEQAWEEGEAGTAFMLDFSRSSGTLVYRLSQ